MFVFRHTLNNFRRFSNQGKLLHSSCRVSKPVNSSRLLHTSKTLRANYHRIAGTSLHGDTVTIHWQNGEKADYHNVWLRDHCRCEKCYNYSTNQREYDMLYMPLDIKPTQANLTSDGEILKLTWPDKHETTYSAEWLKDHAYKTASPLKKGNWIEPFLWNKERITSVDWPKITYPSVIEDDKSCFTVSKDIEKFGFAFVHETPTENQAMENLIRRLAGFVRETLFGGVMDFSNEKLDHADTAYTNARLEAHNDNTYFTDPAGLQLLHCVKHDGIGGENLLVDGFNAAEILKETDIEAYKFLTSRNIPAIYKDDILCIKANNPVIELDPFWGHLKQIRFNMYDRDVLDCIPADDVPKFYRAYQSLAKIIRDPDNEFWFKLQPGACLVMANWRVLHGRDSFTGLRRMVTGYGHKDDFQGQLRSKLDTFKDR